LDLTLEAIVGMWSLLGCGCYFRFYNILCSKNLFYAFRHELIYSEFENAFKLYTLGNPDLLQFLIQNDANVNALNVRGNTPIHLLAMSSFQTNEEKEECCQILIASGADLTFGETPYDQVSISPTFYEQLFQVQFTKVQKDTDNLTVFLRFS